MRSYVFDASALFAFLENGPGAEAVAGLLKEAMRGRAEISMSAANYGEVYGRILRDHARERAQVAAGAVHPLPIRFADATPQRAFHAAEVKAKYKLYYVDSFAAALAIECKASLVTGDADFRRLGHNFPTVWLRA